MADVKFTQLESSRLLLRRFTDSDIEPFLAYRSDPDVGRYQEWEPESYTLNDARRFVRALKTSHPDVPGQWFQFAIEVKATNEMVGDCGLHILRDDPRQAMIGFTLDSSQQGKGYATEAVLRLLDYVFNSLNKHRVIATTDCENTKSIALLERIGMRREGHFLQNIWFKGAWGDEYQYAMLKSEWLAMTHEQP